MRMPSMLRLMVVGAFAASAAACAGEDAAEPTVETPPAAPAVEPAPPPATGATVTFVQPADGATITGTTANVVLSVTGVEIAPATDPRPGTGHHHIFINDDITPLTEVIPMGLPNVRHYGTGATEFALTDLPPGQHRLIAVVADWAHVPLSPLASDTITITVAPAP